MSPPAGGLFIGLMSGTSVDAIDCSLVEVGDTIRLLHCCNYPIPQSMRAEIAALSHAGDDEIERLGILDRRVGALFADAASALITAAGTQKADITAIGCHGQTVRHRPASAGHVPSEAFTLQIGDPNTVAEVTGITTVADFRRRDIAAGGEGAPLAPAFHAAAFAAEGEKRAIVNIGGIANVSLLHGTTLVAGFDSGPGNTLMDHWVGRHRGQACDRDGMWAASGQPSDHLLAALLEHPFLRLNGPRSTGKEAFNLAWLDRVLEDFPDLAPADVQATLTVFTARTIAAAILRGGAIDSVFICGGGAYNGHLMQCLADELAPILVQDTGALGISPDWVEATAFAWLASRRLEGLAGNAPAVTGAAGERVLGAIYPGQIK